MFSTPLQPAVGTLALHWRVDLSWHPDQAASDNWGWHGNDGGRTVTVVFATEPYRTTAAAVPGSDVRRAEPYSSLKYFER
jgi:hypothetical protein